MASQLCGVHQPRLQLRRGALGLLAAIAIGCGPAIARRDANIQKRHESALLEGYQSYRTLMSDVDTEVVWFEYELPPGIDVNGAAGAIARRIVARDACYRTAESTTEATRLRCPDATGTGFQEYLIHIVPKHRQAFVMYAAIRGHTEQQAYPGVVEEFKEEVQSRAQS